MFKSVQTWFDHKISLILELKLISFDPNWKKKKLIQLELYPTQVRFKNTHINYNWVIQKKSLAPLHSWICLLETGTISHGAWLQCKYTLAQTGRKLHQEQHQ